MGKILLYRILSLEIHQNIILLGFEHICVMAFSRAVMTNQTKLHANVFMTRYES